MPNPGFTSSGFAAIACASPFECWAVGSDDNGSPPGRTQTLIEQWDGTSWAVAASPNTGATHNNVLSGVTCASAADCWAAGGSDVEDIHVRDLATGKDLPGVVLHVKFSGISWTHDNRGFFYSRYKGTESSANFSAAARSILRAVTTTLGAVPAGGNA